MKGTINFDNKKILNEKWNRNNGAIKKKERGGDGCGMMFTNMVNGGWGYIGL